MLKVSIELDGKVFKLKDLKPGESGSVRDVGSGLFIIFTCEINDAGSWVVRSKPGARVLEITDKRAIKGKNFEAIRTIKANESVTLTFDHIRGPAVLQLEHERTVTLH